MPSKNTNRILPFNLSFVVTHQCNLNCVYCYESQRDNQQADPNFIKQTIAEYLNNETLVEVFIDFFGGEPWLKFELIKDVCEWTWNQSWKNKYHFHTSTNGTLVHGEIQEWLRSNKHRFSCGLSLDGTKDTHDKNRSNSFDKIDLNFFKECWPTQPVKMTISKYSINSIYNDISYIHSLGFKIAGTNFAEGIDWSDAKFSQILSNELEKLVEFYANNPQYEVAPIINMPIELCESSSKSKKWCGTGRYMAVYDLNQQKYPCQFFTPMTIPSEKFATLKNFNFEDDSNFEDEYCKSNCYFHAICPNCYGANFLVNERIDIRDKSMCNLIKTRAYYSAAMWAHKILNLSTNSDIEQTKIALKIRAIEKIKQLCN